MKKHFLLVISLVFGFETLSISQVNSDWKTAEFKNYTVSYPSDKRMIKNTTQGTFTIYMNLRDNITMEINDLSGYSLSLSEYSRQYLEHLKSQYNTKVLQNVKATTGSLPCQKISCAYDDGHGEIKLKAMYSIWVKNNWAYTMSLTCAPDNFDEWKPITQKVMDSFKVK